MKYGNNSELKSRTMQEDKRKKKMDTSKTHLKLLLCEYICTLFIIRALVQLSIQVQVRCMYLIIHLAIICYLFQSVIFASQSLFSPLICSTNFFLFIDVITICLEIINPSFSSIFCFYIYHRSQNKKTRLKIVRSFYTQWCSYCFSLFK